MKIYCQKCGQEFDYKKRKDFPLHYGDFMSAQKTGIGTFFCAGCFGNYFYITNEKEEN